MCSFWPEARAISWRSYFSFSKDLHRHLSNTPKAPAEQVKLPLSKPNYRLASINARSILDVCNCVARVSITLSAMVLFREADQECYVLALQSARNPGSTILGGLLCCW